MNSDAVLLVSFGGPDRTEEVIPFLENVLRGRDVPRERLLEVAGHYYHFGGKSPINDQNRELLAALRERLARDGPDLPVYWGNRNWHPLLTDTVRQMAADGVRRAFAFVTSAYSSYSGCRQYLEDLDRARASVGDSAPEILKLRVFYNHPGFIEPLAERVRAALECIPQERRDAAALVFTAHSIPVSMAQSSPYVAQIEEACRLVAGRAARPEYRLVYQSRSGPPGQPWLEPDILDSLRRLAAGGIRDVVLAPIGFISDHMEVVYDLDTEARRLCDTLGLNMIRAATVGPDPRFVAMIRELILERTGAVSEKKALGNCGPAADSCAPDCCRGPAIRRPAPKHLTGP